MLERVLDRSWLRALQVGCVRLRGAQKALAQWAVVDDYNAILDLHCRDTRLLQHFAQKYSLRACGIADDVKQARLLRAEAPNAEIFCARKEDIPWRNASFDCVFYQMNSDEAPLDGSFLREAARVLRPGGQLLIAVCGLPDAFARVAERVGLGASDGRTGTRVLLGEMENAGFRDVSYRMARPLVGVAMGWKRA